MLRIAQITESPIDPIDVVKSVSLATVGATSVFIGQVRCQDPQANGAVEAIEYSAHPQALSIMSAIAESFAEAAEVAVIHRIGRLAVGEAAMVVAVGTAHRGEAARIVPMIVDEIKAKVPIWKRQIEVDGRYTWSGLPNNAH